MDADTENPRISIYCDGRNGSHSERRWNFAPFVRPVLAGRTFSWSEQYSFGTAHSTAIITNDDRHLNSKVALEFAAVYERDRSGVNVPATRYGFQFKCPICKVSVECTYDRFAPILDKLAANGLNQISLSGLRATMNMRGSV